MSFPWAQESTCFHFVKSFWSFCLILQNSISHGDGSLADDAALELIRKWQNFVHCWFVSKLWNINVFLRRHICPLALSDHKPRFPIHNNSKKKWEKNWNLTIVIAAPHAKEPKTDAKRRKRRKNCKGNVPLQPVWSSCIVSVGFNAASVSRSRSNFIFTYTFSHLQSFTRGDQTIKVALSAV